MEKISQRGKCSSTSTMCCTSKTKKKNKKKGNKSTKSNSNSNKTPEELAHTLVDRIALEWYFWRAASIKSIIRQCIWKNTLQRIDMVSAGVFFGSNNMKQLEKQNRQKGRKMQQHKSEPVISDNRMRREPAAFSEQKQQHNQQERVKKRETERDTNKWKTGAHRPIRTCFVQLCDILFICVPFCCCCCCFFLLFLFLWHLLFLLFIFVFAFIFTWQISIYSVHFVFWGEKVNQRRMVGTTVVFNWRESVQCIVFKHAFVVCIRYSLLHLLSTDTRFQLMHCNSWVW